MKKHIQESGRKSIEGLLLCVSFSSTPHLRNDQAPLQLPNNGTIHTLVELSRCSSLYILVLSFLFRSLPYSSSPYFFFSDFEIQFQFKLDILHTNYYVPLFTYISFTVWFLLNSIDFYSDCSWVSNVLRSPLIYSWISSRFNMRIFCFHWTF